MQSCCETDNKVIPREFRNAAAHLFSPEKTPLKTAINNAKTFARALGINSDYSRCVETYKEGKDLQDLLISFQNNVELLIQKTWVEKADEIKKDELQGRLAEFTEKIINENYRQALEEFGIILEDLAFLFFGSQSEKSDFTEYTFRIDLQAGLFWWYGSFLCSTPGLEWAKAADKSILLAVLLLGICYLTNF